MISTHLYDNQTIHQQHADKRIFAGEKHVGVAGDVVLDDEEHAEDKEGSVLHEDRHDDAEHVRSTAGVRLSRNLSLSRRTSALTTRCFRRCEDQREL